MSAGILASILTVGAFLPQIIRIIKTKDTKSISLWLPTIQVVAFSLWIVHGLAIQDMPLLMTNISAVILAGIMLVYKLIYK